MTDRDQHAIPLSANTHPATAGGFPGEAPGYAYAAERDALIAPASRAAAARPDMVLGGFSDF